MLDLSRRTLMRLGLAAGVASVGGLGVVIGNPPERLFGRILKDLFPKLNISRDDLRRFEKDLASKYVYSTRQGLSLRAVSVMSIFTGVDFLSGIPKIGSELDDIRHAAVTLFLSNSDYLK